MVMKKSAKGPCFTPRLCCMTFAVASKLSGLGSMGRTGGLLLSDLGLSGTSTRELGVVARRRRCGNLKIFLRKTSQGSTRQSFHASKKRLQFAVLLSSSPIERHLFGAKALIDRLAFGLVGPFEIRPMAFRWIVLTSTPILPTLHHTFQHRSLEEVAQSTQLSL